MFASRSDRAKRRHTARGFSLVLLKVKGKRRKPSVQTIPKSIFVLRGGEEYEVPLLSACYVGYWKEARVHFQFEYTDPLKSNHPFASADHLHTINAFLNFLYTVYLNSLNFSVRQKQWRCLMTRTSWNCWAYALRENPPLQWWSWWYTVCETHEFWVFVVPCFHFTRDFSRVHAHQVHDIFVVVLFRWPKELLVGQTPICKSGLQRGTLIVLNSSELVKIPAKFEPKRCVHKS